MTRVKICGCVGTGDVETAVAAGADAIGLIADVPVDSPRALPLDRAAGLADRVPPFVTATLVTMPESVAAAEAAIEQVRPGAVQIHDPGRLGGPDALDRLRERVSIPVIVACDLAGDRERDPVDAAAGLARHADAILVDATDASGAGGTGRTADWERAASLCDRIETPLILAGGLTPGNVADAIGAVGPFAVDVATGVEAADPDGRADGRNDPAAVQQFVSRAAQADATEVTAP